MKTAIHNPIGYIARKISAIDVTSVKKVQTLIRRCVGDAAADLGLQFCICPKVPFRMTLAIYEKGRQIPNQDNEGLLEVGNLRVEALKMSVFTLFAFVRRSLFA